MKKNILLIVMLLLQIGVHGREGSEPDLRNQPFSFRENKGQVRDQQGNIRTDIDFIMQTPDLILYIGKGQLHYQFIKAAHADTTTCSKANPPKSYRVPGGSTMYRLDVNLVNSDKNAVVLTEEPVQERYHYYNSPNSNAEGIADVHAYKKIIYQNVYPGIDWVLYTNGKGFKYDFVVHPGGKVSDIQLKYDGATSMKLATNGSLDIATPLGSLIEETPYSYERESKNTISSKFVLKDNIVSFKTGGCKNTLVIDPGVKWATYFGGTSADGTLVTER
jgi:hypothetical protein